MVLVTSDGAIASIEGSSGFRLVCWDLVITARLSAVSSRSLMKSCHRRCSSSCSVESVVLGKSSRAGDTNPGTLGSRDNGSTLEWILPGLCIMTISGKAANTSPQAASLLFAFSYVFAQVNAEWSVTSSTLSPSIRGWKRTRASLAARASRSVAEYRVSAACKTLLQYAITLSTGIGFLPSCLSSHRKGVYHRIPSIAW